MQINGRKIRDRIEGELREKLLHRSVKPTLAIFIVGENPVIEGFVNLKKRFAHNIGVQVLEQRFPIDVSQDEFNTALDLCVQNSHISGIVVQLPLPSHLDTEIILNTIPPSKDVDVLSVLGLKNFEQGTSPILPPVVGAVREIFRETNVELSGKKALVVGRGRLVGMPVSMWLRAQGALVEVVDRSSGNLSEYTRWAEIIVSGAGVPGLIQSEMLTPGVALIDAGSSEDRGRVVGDIAPECEHIAQFITPVPGGVGPITVAVLFQNLVRLSEESH